jgi:hypothetical protein
MRYGALTELDNLIDKKLRQEILEPGSYGFARVELLLQDKEIYYLLGTNDVEPQGKQAKKILIYRINKLVKEAPKDDPISKLQNVWIHRDIDKKGYPIFKGEESIDPATGLELPIDKKTGKRKERQCRMKWVSEKDKDGNTVLDSNGVAKKKLVKDQWSVRAWTLPDDTEKEHVLKVNEKIVRGRLSGYAKRAEDFDKDPSTDGFQEAVDNMVLQKKQKVDDTEIEAARQRIELRKRKKQEAEAAAAEEVTTTVVPTS